MIQNNLNENEDPKDVITPETSFLENEEPEKENDEEEERDDDDDEGYEILPSNGSGLAGDDGEQVVEEDEEE